MQLFNYIAVSCIITRVRLSLFPAVSEIDTVFSTACLKLLQELGFLFAFYLFTLYLCHFVSA